MNVNAERAYQALYIERFESRLEELKRKEEALRARLEELKGLATERAERARVFAERARVFNELDYVRFSVMSINNVLEEAEAEPFEFHPASQAYRYELRLNALRRLLREALEGRKEEEARERALEMSYIDAERACLMSYFERIEERGPRAAYVLKAQLLSDEELERTIDGLYHERARLSQASRRLEHTASKTEEAEEAAALLSLRAFSILQARQIDSLREALITEANWRSKELEAQAEQGLKELKAENELLKENIAELYERIEQAEDEENRLRARERGYELELKALKAENESLKEQALIEALKGLEAESLRREHEEERA